MNFLGLHFVRFTGVKPLEGCGWQLLGKQGLRLLVDQIHLGRVWYGHGGLVVWDLPRVCQGNSGEERGSHKGGCDGEVSFHVFFGGLCCWVVRRDEHDEVTGVRRKSPPAGSLWHKEEERYGPHH